MTRPDRLTPESTDGPHPIFRCRVGVGASGTEELVIMGYAASPGRPARVRLATRDARTGRPLPYVDLAMRPGAVAARALGAALTKVFGIEPTGTETLPQPPGEVDGTYVAGEPWRRGRWVAPLPRQERGR
jgi:hypothetical protein